jgi:hypothetical protein
MREDVPNAGANAAAQEDAKRAMIEVQRYLADEIAPMMAADAAAVLVRMPPKYGAVVVRSWIEAQLRTPDRAVPVSSYVYHAMKKLHHLAELRVVEAKEMSRYVADLSRMVVRLCPEAEQTDLRLQLSRIAEAETTLSAPVQLLNRELSSAAEETRLRQTLEATEEDDSHPRVGLPPASPRLAMLTGRLEELRGAPTQEAACEAAQDLVARVLTTAATEARDGEQLEASLARLRQLGVEAEIDRRMFRLLGRRLPEWEVDLERAKPDDDRPAGRLLQAMRGIVAMAGSSEEGIRRFSEMVYAAIEQFNEGHLAQAVAMLDLAQRLIEEKKVDGELARIVKNRAQSAVDLGPLRQFASTSAKHGLLRKVLRFFPIFTPDSILDRLDGEPKRETRKLMLSLLEVHGPPCRTKILDRLTGYASGKLPDPSGFYSRNVMYLLKRIPRGAHDDVPSEIALLAEYSRPQRPFMVTKEAVGALAGLSLPKVSQILAQRLEDFERSAHPGATDYTGEEMLEILDRTCAALASLGTQEAVRKVVAHARLEDPRLGDTVGRLRHLAGCDLSGHDALREILDWLRKALPAKVLGVVLGRRVGDAISLVQALSGTRQPEVLRLFEEIVQRYAGQDFAERAREALATFQAGSVPVPAAAEGVAGDLELFGLPALLQSLADARQTGRLTVSERNGHDRAVILFCDGSIAGAEAGQLRDEYAVYEIIERPRPGSFRFERTPPEDTARAGHALEVVPLILEAMRRYDEFQEDRALVPDGTSLMPTGARPSLPEDENDRNLVEAVWREASRGTAPESYAGLSGSDSYRVRRLYAHWLENGALKRRPAA